MTINSTSNKPLHYTASEKWLTPLVFLWTTVFSCLGFFFVGKTEAISAPLLTLTMFFIGKATIKTLLSMHQRNKSISRRTFDHALLFFWASGFLSSLCFVLQGILLSAGDVDTAYFFLTCAAFPLGISAGTAHKWDQRFSYE